MGRQAFMNRLALVGILQRSSCGHCWADLLTVRERVDRHTRLQIQMKPARPLHLLRGEGHLSMLTVMCNTMMGGDTQ